MKARHPRTTKPKHRREPTAARRHASAVNLQKQLDQRTRELVEAQKHLAEALEQQTATAEILSVISSSLDDTQPVFDAIVQSGLKLFRAPRSASRCRTAVK